MKRLLNALKPLALRVLGQQRYLSLRLRLLPMLQRWGLAAAHPVAPVLAEPEPTPTPETTQDDRYAEILAQNITFSIVVPVYNTPERFLRQCLDSVFGQIYPHWELILVDDNSPDPNVRPLLEEAGARDNVKVIFREQNGNISKAVNDGLAAATGDYFTVLDHDDILHSAALYWMVDALLTHPDADYLYSDEDKTDETGTRFFGAFLKPGWSPELTLQCMYSCHMSVFDREKAQQMGGYRSAFDGAQDFDFMLRFVAKHDKVVHVDKVLYHWREWEQSTALDLDAKPEAYLRQRRALREYLDGKSETYVIGDHELRGHHKVSFLPRREDKISILIPTANATMEIDGEVEFHADAVVASVLETSTYENFEIVLAHNGDLSAAQLSRFEAEPKVRLVHYDDSAGFNLADKINQCAQAATGAYFLLLNDDIRVITPNWLERMLGMGQRPGVGAVGVKLLYPNNTVQHGGVWIRGNVPGHIDFEAPRDVIGYDFSGTNNRNCIGVTGACKLVPRTVWEHLGGYDRSFALNYNDVDFCLRIHEAGMRSVYLGDVELYHYEGVSRDGGGSVADKEIQLFLDTWKIRLPVDPYLPSNLA